MDFKNEKSYIKILPTKYPMITTYTQHAHLISILSNYECTYPWIFSNYIMLYMNKDLNYEWGDFYFPFPYELRPSDTCKWIISEKIHRENVIGNWKLIVDFVIQCINSGSYVNTMVNSFYIPLRRAYKKKHFNHDIFVYGYNLKKEIFYVSDFFRNGRYESAELAFSTFSQAFEEYYENNIIPDYLNKMVYLYKFNHQYKDKYNFNINNIIESIKKYIYGEIPEYWSVYNYEDDKKNVHFGMEVYITLKNYIKRKITKDSSQINILPFYLLYDHKKIMSLRIKYLEKHGYLNTCSYRSYNEIEYGANEIIKILIKYYFTKNKSLLERTINILVEIEKEEYDFLCKYIYKM